MDGGERVIPAEVDADDVAEVAGQGERIAGDALLADREHPAAYDAKTGKLMWIDDANYVSPDYNVVGEYAHSVSFSPDGKLIFVQIKLEVSNPSGWRYITQVYETTTGKVIDRLYYTGGVNPTKTYVNIKSQNFILYANLQGGGTDLFSKVVAYSAN